MQAIFAEHQARNPDLGGTVDLWFVVEWTGEIGPIKIKHSTIENPEFLNKVPHPIQLFDFDGWGTDEEDTEALYPISFGV